MSGLGLTFLRRGNLTHPTEGNEKIVFADAEVESILMEHGVSSNGVIITMADAAKVTSIGTWFRAKTITSFNELRFFTGIERINDYAFYQCRKLNEIQMPPQIVKIGILSFSECNLAHFEVGEKVTNIYNSFLEKNTNMQYIICRPTSPPTLGNFYTFSQTNSCPIYVPDESLTAYQKANLWSEFKSRIKPLSEFNG